MNDRSLNSASVPLSTPIIKHNKHLMASIGTQNHWIQIIATLFRKKAFSRKNNFYENRNEKSDAKEIIFSKFIANCSSAKSIILFGVFESNFYFGENPSEITITKTKVITKNA